MGYREDVIEYLLTSAPKEQQEYFNIKNSIKSNDKKI